MLEDHTFLYSGSHNTLTCQPLSSFITTTSHLNTQTSYIQYHPSLCSLGPEILRSFIMRFSTHGIQVYLEGQHNPILSLLWDDSKIECWPWGMEQKSWATHAAACSDRGGTWSGRGQNEGRSCKCPTPRAHAYTHEFSGNYLSHQIRTLHLGMLTSRISVSFTSDNDGNRIPRPPWRISMEQVIRPDSGNSLWIFSLVIW